MKLIKLLLISLLMLSLLGCDNKSELKLHIISDIHYAPKKYYEYTSKFKESNDNNGTGKQIKYQEEIIDAYINEEIANNTKYVVITGDLVFSGSIKAHKEFVSKFHKLIDNGIKVLVIPGNHDFDYYPFTYENETMIYSSQITSLDFKDIYKEYGYQDALSIDNDSLSYLYKLDNNFYLLALDTINNYGNVDGEISEETLNWINSQLEYVKSKNSKVIVVGHHNLYTHNDLYDFGYRINNADKLIELFNKYDVNLYLSGHMHIQDILKTTNITEILNESFSIYPHRYGELIVNNNEYSYASKNTDIEKFTTSSNSDLLNYNTYGYNYLYNSFYNQIINRLEDIDNIDNKLINDEALLNTEYFMGIRDTNDYSYLLNNENKKYISGYIKSILKYINKHNLTINGKMK